MGEEFYNTIKETIKQIEEELVRTDAMLAFLRDAGEDVSELEKTRRELIRRKENWKRALAARGISID